MPTIGFDIGGTNVRAVVLADDGARLAEWHERRDDAWDALVDQLTAIVDAARTAPGGVSAVGVGIAGMVDADGVMHFGPNLPGVEHAPVRAALARRTGLPVAVDNDANVAALGETVFGAARGRAHVLLVTLGTGIGGGLVLGGRIYRGAHGFAGEIGHFTVQSGGPQCACGATGHWEALASGNALGAQARGLAQRGGLAAVVARAGSPGAVRGEHVVAAARDGDAPARELLAAFAEHVAVGLAALVNILDPEVVVIGGGLAGAGDVLLAPVRSAFARHVEGGAERVAVEIVGAQLGDDAGMLGAALLAREASG